MHAVTTFMNGLMSMPWYWQIWVNLLGLVNFVIPLFFLKHKEARVVLAAICCAAPLMMVLTAATGFTRILGLAHIVFWVPLVAYLLRRLPEIPAQGFYGSWLRSVVAIDLVSLVIDVSDVIRYIGGERMDLSSLF